MFGYKEELQDKIEALKLEKKLLEVKILEFRNKIATTWHGEDVSCDYWLPKYDEHFGIKVVKEAKIV